MATNISEEEFLRLQSQLIELRTANYSLEEQYGLQVSRNKQLSMRVEALEKECTKMYSSLSSSKKLKNSELIQQNEALQLKLQAQEDEFRLQNQTLLQELSSLVIENEKLGSKLTTHGSKVESASQVNEEIKKLRLEATALQRALSEERLRSAHEVSKLKETLNLFVENMDEDIHTELFSGTEYEVYHNQEGIDSSSPILFMKDEEDSVDEVMVDYKDAKEEEEVKKPGTTAGLVYKEYVDNIKENDEVEFQKVTKELKVEKECNAKLKTALCMLQQQFSERKDIAEKKISELNENLRLLLDDQEKQVNVINTYNYQKGELESQIQQLKKELSEHNIETEIVRSQLVESVRSIEQLNNQVSSLQLQNEELLKSENNAKMESNIRKHLIQEMTLNNDSIVADCEDKIRQLEKNLRVVEQKYLKENDHLLKIRSNLHEAEESIKIKNDQLKELEQQLVDITAERSLNEKKGAVICRDLRRQLAAERRRVEKLQEKLREITDSTSLTKQDPSKSTDAEITSVSSWSLMSGNLEPQESSTQESSLVTGSLNNINETVFSAPDDTNLEQENKNLLERVTSLQEEKWVLEEKINHLEQGNAAMAEDLMRKSQVIEYYCMEGRPAPEPQPSTSGKKTVKKISEFWKLPEEEKLQDVNGRMHRLLEEMLTKNMHLQRDMEQMSREIECLRHALNAKEE